MWKDPIVEEVRLAGEKLAEQCDYDVHKFGLMLKEETERLRKEGWTVVSYADMYPEENVVNE